MCMCAVVHACACAIKATHTEKKLIEGVDGLDVLALLAEEGEIGEDDARLGRLHFILWWRARGEKIGENSQLDLGPGSSVGTSFFFFRTRRVPLAGKMRYFL